MDNLQEPLLVTIDEASRRLSVSVSMIYRLIDRGRLRVVRMGKKCTRIPVSELEAIANRNNAPETADGQAERSRLE